MSRRVPLFLLVCFCTGSLFAQDVCNSEQTQALEQTRVAWHESGRPLADGGHPRDGQSQESAHSFLLLRGSAQSSAALTSPPVSRFCLLGMRSPENEWRPRSTWESTPDLSPVNPHSV